MDFVIGALGFFIGLFLWSNIFGGLFGTLPLQKALVKDGEIPKVDWIKIVVSILIAVAILVLTFIFAKTFFFGAAAAGFIMLFNIGKLKREAVQNYLEEKSRSQQTKITEK